MAAVSGAVGTGSWAATGTPRIPRTGHTLTLLKDGRALMTGGVASPSAAATSSTQIWNPASGTWASAAAMTTARAFHTATLLPDGRVLVVGGYDPNPAAPRYINSSETYDPVKNAWSGSGPFPDQNGPAYHTATLLPDGRVLIAGGIEAGGRSGSRLAGEGCYNDGGFHFTGAQLWLPSTGLWSNASGCIITPRFGHTATLLFNGTLLIGGGRNSASPPGYFNAAEAFDPGAAKWTSVGGLARGRAFHVASLLSGGRVLAAGGITAGGVIGLAEVYDPGSRTWSATGSMATPRQQAAAVPLSDGAVLVAGGYPALAGATTSAELYDAAAGKFVGTGSMTSPRGAFPLALLAGANAALAAAGAPNFQGSADGTAEVYNYTPPPPPTVVTVKQPPSGTPPPKVKIPPVVPGCTPTAANAVFAPPLARPGFVTQLRGSGFCAGPVLFSWSPPLMGAPVAATADATGNLPALTILVLPREKPGIRIVTITGAGGASLVRPFLVVPSPAGPPSFAERR